jgi:DNA-binding MurR/RpiR family transcriptional regulator
MAVEEKNDMTNQSCFVKIQNHLKFFTNSETKIAHYVLENYNEILNYTITELAEKVDTSDASVIRFCRSIGYKGYQDFKINMARDIAPANKLLDPELDREDTPEEICQKIFFSEMAVLKDTLAILDIKMLEKAAKVIVAAKRIELFGSGGSALVGMDAQHKLLKVGLKSFVHCDADIQAMSASLLGAGDVAIGISHSGSNRNVVRCMQLAKQQGATTIVMTTQGKSPLLKFADVVLFTATKETAFKSESATARIAQLALVDALVAMVALGDYDNSLYAIGQTRKATSDNKF